MLDLNGKTALLAGTKRIGERVAQRLSMEGVNLAIAYRSSRAEAERLESLVSRQGCKTCVVQGDLTNEEDVDRLVGEAADALGGLHFVINLASDYPSATLDDMSGPVWDSAMGNAKGSYLLCASAARIMRNNGLTTNGHLIMFTDWAAGATPYTGYLPYLTAKAAVGFMTRAFAAELAPHRILVNSIAPGPTMRPPEISEESWDKDVLAQAPLKRESSADEIAEIVVTLLKSETITGETIRVDSGRHIAGPGVVDHDK